VVNILGGDVVIIVVTHGPEVTTGSGGVVGLRRMSDCVVLREQDTLFFQSLECGGGGRIVVVSVLEPDLGK
jgi:hypothetical protein